MDMNSNKLQDTVQDREAWSQRIRQDWATEEQQLTHLTGCLETKKCRMISMPKFASVFTMELKI